MKKKLNNIWSYFLGNYRYFIYYSPVSYLLMRKFIHEQIEMRVASMNLTCYQDGACTECGCKTIALQMCNRACEGDCYPEMATKDVWYNILLKDKIGIFKSGLWKITNNKFKKIIVHNGMEK